jgi:DNA-binding SARP family transcriptional activator
MATALCDTPLLRMRLLGGFHVEHADVTRAVSGWPRRSAKTLTKLLATCPGHALHREQVLDILWPGTDVNSALNSFGKALHAARHAFEPDLPRRADSAYLVLTDAMLALNTDHVVIDADRFEELAENALRNQDATAHESALAAYGGELLPEDRYADWCAERRSFLAELRVRLLVGLAGALENRGACNEAADHLRAALGQDPTREVAHRRLMRLYAEMGTPDQAVRQFQICADVLQRELDMAPQPETVALYRNILGSGVPPRSPAADRGPSVADRNRSVVNQHPPLGAEATLGGPFVGRDCVIQHLCGRLARGTQPRAGMILLTGEAGIGKTRLLEELAAQAGRQGAAVLWSGRGAHAKQFACGLFAVALESYAASRTATERHELAGRYPALARFIPSLGTSEPVPAPRDYHLDLIPAIVRLLTDLGRKQPVLLVLNDLHDADPVSLDLVRYLAHLAVQRPWLMVGAVREEEVEAGSELSRLMEAMTRERLSQRLELRCLSRPDCDQLVRALLRGARASDEFLARIYRLSRGNPLFVRELARQLSQTGDPALAAGDQDESWRAAARVPARVRAMAVMRLAAMDETLRRVLLLAAASGAAEISLGALRIGTAALEPPVSDAALLDALDQALQMRVLEEGSSGFAFRHPLFRSAVYEGLSRHRRDQLHAALAPGDGYSPKFAVSPTDRYGTRPLCSAGVAPGSRASPSASAVFPGRRSEERWNPDPTCLRTGTVREPTVVHSLVPARLARPQGRVFLPGWKGR